MEALNLQPRERKRKARYLNYSLSQTPRQTIYSRKKVKLQKEKIIAEKKKQDKQEVSSSKRIRIEAIDERKSPEFEVQEFNYGYDDYDYDDEWFRREISLERKGSESESESEEKHKEKDKEKDKEKEENKQSDDEKSEGENENKRNGESEQSEQSEQSGEETEDERNEQIGQNESEDEKSGEEEENERNEENEENRRDEQGEENGQNKKDKSEGIKFQRKSKFHNLDPIYYKSKLNVLQSMVMIESFRREANLTRNSFQTFLDLIHNLCPDGLNLPKTPYLHEKFFENEDLQLKKVYFCPSCFIENKSTEKENCSECLIEFSYYYDIPIEPQIKELFKSNFFCCFLSFFLSFFFFFFLCFF